MIDKFEREKLEFIEKLERLYQMGVIDRKETLSDISVHTKVIWNRLIIEIDFCEEVYTLIIFIYLYFKSTVKGFNL